MAAREAKTAATGKKPGGKPPAPPVEGPLPADQVNLTDEESRIMPVAGGGFDQCYNAQAAVAAGSLLVVATDVVQASNDKQQVEPMLEKIEALPEGLGEVEHLLADTGYFSAGNVEACEKTGVEPVIAMGRQPSHSCLQEGVNAATTHIHMHRHLDLDHCRERLAVSVATNSDSALEISLPAWSGATAPSSSSSTT